MTWTFELVAGPYGFVSEGPAWDGRHLYFSLIQKGVIMRYDPKTGECSEWRNNAGLTNGLMFDAAGRLYGCGVRGRSILRLDPDGRTTTIVDRLDGKRLNTPNDLAIDSKGRIWFSNPWNYQLMTPDDRSEIDEAVLRADPKPDGTWSLTRAVIDITGPNGVLMSADERTLYVAQSDYGVDRARELRAYPIASDGSLGPYITLHQFGKDHRGVHRGVDGMCLDAEGNIIATAGWRTSGPGPLLYVFTPTGRVLETHPVPPSAHPTNCTFGDADLRSLYVTTVAGHLYRVRTDRRGFNLYP